MASQRTPTARSGRPRGLRLSLRAVGTDFAAEGLLDGLEGSAREARLELLEQLAAEGVSLADLRAASRDGRLLFVGAERAMGGQPRYSTREVGERVGLAPEFLMALRRRRGCPSLTWRPWSARTPTSKRRRSRAPSWRRGSGSSSSSRSCA